MVNAARKYNRVTQVGTQQRSMPLNNWASDLVKNGALGKIHTVIAPNFVGPDRWTNKPAEPMPDGGSDNWWDIWTNQAELRPYHSRPRITAGIAGGTTTAAALLRRHRLGHALLRPDQPRPGHRRHRARSKSCSKKPVADRETPASSPEMRSGGVVGDTDDDTGTDYHGMAKLAGPRAKVTMKFANGTELKLHLDGDRGPGLGAIFVGEKGKIEINRDKIASNPKEIVRSPDNPGHNKRPETAYHIENWVECIKSRKPLQRRHRDRPAGDDALLSGEHRPRHRPRRRDAEVGSGRRAVHQLRRGQQAAVPAAAQRVRIAGHRRLSGSGRT